MSNEHHEQHSGGTEHLESGRIYKIDWGEVTAYFKFTEPAEIATRALGGGWNIREIDGESYHLGIQQAQPAVSRVGYSESPWGEE